MQTTVLEYFKAYSISILRPLQVNSYKRLTLKKYQIPLRNFQTVEVSGHHVNDAQHNLSIKAPQIAAKTSLSAYKLNIILLCNSKATFSTISITK